MEYDPTRSIPTEITSDTPELLQECVDLKEAIDTHVDDWYEQAIAFHPGTNGRFSKIIAHDCSPIEGDVESLVTAARFQKRLNEEDAYMLKLKLERQKLLSVPANDSSLDKVEIDNPKAAEAFALIRETRDYPNSNKWFVKAYDHLYRLFVTREQLAKQIGPDDSFDTSNEFSWILHRVFDERHLGAK